MCAVKGQQYNDAQSAKAQLPPPLPLDYNHSVRHGLLLCGANYISVVLLNCSQQIMTLKKENFNLKLRIYFMEERMQQKCDDSTEDIYKTNIELKVEVESMKRDLAEKQELLVSASKALESLAGRESGDTQRVRERAQREMDMVRDTLNRRIAELERDLKSAEEEVEKMAAIAEQDKVRCIGMEKQLLALGLSGTFPPLSHDLQQALEEKNRVMEQLRQSVKNQEAVIQQLQSAGKDQGSNAPCADQVQQLSALIGQKDEELRALKADLGRANERTERDQQRSGASRLEVANRLLNEELDQFRATNQNLSKTLEDTQTNNKVISGKLEETENELVSEKKNALKRDKTIQGLTLVLKEKEKEIDELCHEIEDRDEALAKAREAAHKAQLQKYQGAEERQSLLTEVQAELAQLQGEHHAKLLEAQKLQRSLGRREQELEDLQQAKELLDQELEELQQQKKKGDKALNEVQNQLKKLTGELGERESSLKEQYQELLEQSKRRLQGHEVTIQHLTTCLADKEQQLQDYMNMMRDMEQSRSPGEGDTILSKLRERLKQKEKALEEALDDKFMALEEKDNEIHRLHLSLREKERDLERLNNLLSHNEETISSFDALIKEKDVEQQHLADTLKNLQRAKQDVEDNLNRACREKDSIIGQLQRSLEGKTKDMEEMASALLSQSQSQASDLAEQMGQRLKVTEAMLAEAVKARERLVADNKCAVEELLATVNSKDQLLKESAERYNHTLSQRTQEIQDLKRQLCTLQQELASAEKHRSTATQEASVEVAKFQALLTEKDSIINKLLDRGNERDQFLAELKLNGPSPPQVLELRQTIQVLQERLEEKEAELSKRNNNDDTIEKVPLTKKTLVILKKELAQKTEGLNKALKRENELKMSLADLQSVLSELEGRVKGQDASIDSLTATLETKNEIIHVSGWPLLLHTDTLTQAATGERALPGLPQRERTNIGGDSQDEALPTLADLQVEHQCLNRALRAEQQLYSSLVRTIKEQDSAQRIHALQMELTAVTLLRQQLEEGIRSNDQLRQQLDREISRAKQSGEGALQSIRHQLEDAHRWNASLQARLGAIQNRQGGVGANNDTADTLGSFLADQTSYMSICVGEGEGLEHLSVEELRQKDYISRLEAVNGELQRGLQLAEGSGLNLSFSSSGKEVGPISNCLSPGTSVVLLNCTSLFTMVWSFNLPHRQRLTS
uniref:CDK5 regulatory subunit associated protein 2 n=1 Tax=Esox lucius TaxID=8010 RepID=A0A3P8Z2L7_ESOLU